MNQRINSLSEYHFKKIDDLKENLKASGKSYTDLSIGDPDLPLNENIRNELLYRIGLNAYNNYPPYDGITLLKDKIIDHYSKIYNVRLNRNQVLILIGSKEGLNNLIPAVCDFNDVVIAPDLGYPVYSKCSLLWGCQSYKMKLNEKNDYLPEIHNIPKNILEKSKLMFINYPNNPTGSIGNPVYIKEIIKLCKNNEIILCNDSAYMDIVSSDENSMSLLQYDKDLEFIEMGSFSKTFNMTGLRIGFAVGSESIINNLAKIKNNVDSGQYVPIQYAAVEALNIYEDYIKEIRGIYDERRNTAYEMLDENQLEYYKGKGTFYIWCKCPNEMKCNEYVEWLIKEKSVIVTPGICFGEDYDDYFRIALTKEKEEIRKALKSLK